MPIAGELLRTANRATDQNLDEHGECEVFFKAA
jgi:hypothetical protein